MKIAEGLVLRADLQRRVEALRQRLTASVLVQEGLQPPEDPQALFAELDGLLETLTTLIARINRNNLQATLADGTSLTVALARRDILKLQISVLGSAAQGTTRDLDRYSRSESWTPRSRRATGRPRWRTERHERRRASRYPQARDSEHQAATAEVASPICSGGISPLTVLPSTVTSASGTVHCNYRVLDL